MNDAEPLPGRRCGGVRGRHGIFFPFVLITLGAIFLCDQMNWIAADRVFAYFWPLVFIIFGLEAVSGRNCRSRVVVGVVALGVGVALLLNTMGYWYFDVWRLWPLALILFGLSLLFRPYDRGRRRGYKPASATAAAGGPAVADTSESFVDAVAVLGGYNRRITAQNFTGGHITTFLGGMQLDLTQAGIACAEAVLDITAFMGGAELRVPNTWEIEVQGQPFLGGFNDETQQLPTANAKRLVIRGIAVMGGVNIKN